MFSRSTLSSCFPFSLGHTVSSSPAQPSLLTAEIFGGATFLPQWLGCGKWIPSFHNTGGHSFSPPSTHLILNTNNLGGGMVNPIS